MSDLTPEDEERLDLVGEFVVDFDPGLYGPFKTRRLATEWASSMVGLHGERGRTYSWTVASLGPVDVIPVALLGRSTGGAA